MVGATSSEGCDPVFRFLMLVNFRFRFFLFRIYFSVWHCAVNQTEYFLSLVERLGVSIIVWLEYGRRNKVTCFTRATLAGASITVVVCLSVCNKSLFY